MFSSRFRVLIPFSLLALALTATPGYSTTTTFSNFASWNAAATILQTIDFAGLAPNMYPGGTPQFLGTTVQFIGYTSPGINWAIVDTSSSMFFNFGTHDAVQLQMDRASAGPLPHFQITLPSPVTAFGVDLFSASPTGLTFTVTVAGTQYSAPTNTFPGTPGFFGITSNTPFTTVDLTLQGTVFNGGSLAFIDNVRYGTAQADTPEVVTSVLVGFGLLWIGFMRRRTKTNPTLQPA